MMRLAKKEEVLERLSFFRSVEAGARGSYKGLWGMQIRDLEIQLQRFEAQEAAGGH